MSIKDQIESLVNPDSPLRVYTLGTFKVIRDGHELNDKDWGRDKTLQLFQFLVLSRSRGALHKEQIMDRLWEDDDDQTFKVAMHGINKTLEPERPARVEPKYVLRSGLSYKLNEKDIWVDAEAMEQLIIIGNQHLNDDDATAIEAYRNSLSLYQGNYIPARIYEDWTTAERERIQILVINTYTQLAELLKSEHPQEAIRLCQEALSIDSVWEDAYRIQMEAYIKLGNRPLALKTYLKCKATLNEEFGIDPLPITQKLHSEITKI